MGVEILIDAALVIGCAQLLKQFGVRGKARLAAALVIGLLVFGPQQAYAYGLISETTFMWYDVVVTTIGMVLAIPGLYDLAVNELGNGK
jgi:hypothetical protein